MARNLFTENNPVRGTGKTNNIPDVNWLSNYATPLYTRYHTTVNTILAT